MRRGPTAAATSRRRQGGGASGATYVSNGVMPWDTLSRADIAASPSKVLVHQFATDVGPISINDTTFEADYQNVNWMPPGALEGAQDYRPVGGLTRDRPIWRPSRGTGYLHLDRITETHQMRDAGASGQVIDVLGLSGSNVWTRVVGYFDAAADAGVTGDFVCAPMFDLTGPAIHGAAEEAIVAAIVTLNGKAAAYKVGGRMQVYWYGPEVTPFYNGATQPRKPVSYFQSITTKCFNAGINIDQHFCVIYDVQEHLSRYVPVAKTLGRWGDRNPLGSNDPGVQNRGLTQWIYDSFGGMGSLYPVSPGDVRPNVTAGNNWNEQRGTEQFRVSWDAAIRGNGTAQGRASSVQIPTWNDWSETANICPSMLHGWVLSDLNNYFVAKYLTGEYPEIKREALFLSHKSQFSTGMTWTSGTFTNEMELVGGTPAWDNIEVLAFVTDPAGTTVEITSGGVTVTHAGLSQGMNVLTAPLRAGAAGSVSARMVRGGSTVTGTAITSPWAVSHTAPVHDPAWRMGSSLRGWSSTYPTQIWAASNPTTIT